MGKIFIFDTERQSVDEVCRIIREVYEQDRKDKEIRVPRPEPVREAIVKQVSETVSATRDLEFQKGQLVDIKTMAKILHTSPSWLYSMTSQKKIPFSKLGRHVRFEPHRVLEHFKKEAAKI